MMMIVIEDQPNKRNTRRLVRRLLEPPCEQVLFEVRVIRDFESRSVGPLLIHDELDS